MPVPSRSDVRDGRRARRSLDAALASQSFAALGQQRRLDGTGIPAASPHGSEAGSGLPSPSSGALDASAGMDAGAQRTCREPKPGTDPPQVDWSGGGERPARGCGQTRAGWAHRFGCQRDASLRARIKWNPYQSSGSAPREGLPVAGIYTHAYFLAFSGSWRCSIPRHLRISGTSVCGRIGVSFETNGAVLSSPVPSSRSDGRVRCWRRIPEAGGRALRVILLAARKTIHNAFFDRDFVEPSDESQVF